MLIIINFLIFLSLICPSFSEIIPLEIDFSYRFSINPNQFENFQIFGCWKIAFYDKWQKFYWSIFFFKFSYFFYFLFLKNEEIQQESMFTINNETLYFFCLVGFRNAYAISREVSVKKLEYYISIKILLDFK